MSWSKRKQRSGFVFFTFPTETAQKQKVEAAQPSEIVPLQYQLLTLSRG
jgi:hypothetical protein